MNAKELAAKINGTEYPFFPSNTGVDKEAAAHGLVIVYGASDDLMEFAGAIDDEIGCYDGGTAYLTSAGLLTNDCENENCPHFAKLKEQAATIEAVWSEEGYSWIYKTTIPHETFEIVEDGEKYCRGIVFSLADVKGSAGMTVEQFKATRWGPRMHAIYKGENYPIIACNFDECLVGLTGVTLGSDDIDWVRCENITLAEGGAA